MKRKLSKKQQKWEDTVKDYATALFIIRHGCTPTDADIQELLTSVLVKYIVFMIAYMAITYFVYNRRYTKGRREVKKYYGNLKKLNQLYEREDKLKMSENKDWE